MNLGLPVIGKTTGSGKRQGLFDHAGRSSGLTAAAVQNDLVHSQNDRRVVRHKIAMRMTQGNTREVGSHTDLVMFVGGLARMGWLQSLP